HGSIRAQAQARFRLARRSRLIPSLHAILDVEASARAGWDALDLAQAFLDGGAPLIQIRAKQLASAPFLDLCDAAVKAAEGYRVPIIVNDRADPALMSRRGG